MCGIGYDPVNWWIIVQEGMVELVAEGVSRRLSGVGIILFYEKKLPALRNYGIFAVGLEGSDLLCAIRAEGTPLVFGPCQASQEVFCL